jgi:hypothetical protein
VVSASNDHSVIFWDLRSLEFVRQLPELHTPATAVHVNDMTGEIVTAAGMTLIVWSINGDCLAAVNTSQLTSDTILSITSPHVSDWMEFSWYITGHENGSIRLWQMDFDSHSLPCVVKAQSRVLDSFSTPDHRLGTRISHTRSVIAPSTVVDFRRSGSGAFFGKGDTSSSCITGGTPEYQLVLRKVLKWHKESVTALHLSNDLKQLCSGDSGGHVVSWTLSDDAFKNPLLQASEVLLDSPFPGGTTILLILKGSSIFHEIL